MGFNKLLQSSCNKRDSKYKLNDFSEICSGKNIKERWTYCGKFIFDFIKKSKSKFLLKEVVSIIRSFRISGIVHPNVYNYYDFEAWLVKFCEKDDVDKCLYKIFGLSQNKYIQSLQFGSGAYINTEQNIHVITPHANPDADAICSSFFSWMVASSVRVSKISNTWSLCGILSSKECIVLFEKMFGENVFDILSYQGHNVSAFVKSLPWKADAKTEEGVCIFEVDLGSNVQTILAKVSSHEKINIKVTISEGKDKHVLGVLDSNACASLSKCLMHLSLRDFNDLQETRLLGHYQIKSIVDHHFPKNIAASYSCLIRISDDQSCSSILTQDLYEIFTKKLNKSLSVSDKFIEYSAFILTLSMLDDTDSFDRIVAGDMYSLAKMAAIFEWIDSPKTRPLPCAEILKYSQENIKKSLSSHKIFSKFFHSYQEIKELSITSLIDEAIKTDMVSEAQIFSDTKMKESGIIGQIKLMENNWAHFKESSDNIRKKWLSKSEVEALDIKDPINIMMISTIGDVKTKKYNDEWWVWEPKGQDKGKCLAFLMNLSESEYAKNVLKIKISSYFFDERSESIAEILLNSFCGKITTEIDYALYSSPVFIVSIKQGSMNARKRSVSPFIP